MAANESFLSQLHEVLAEDLLRRIKSGEATASDLNVTRQFLKDNGVECVGRKNPKTKQLVDELSRIPDDMDSLHQ